MRIDQSIGSAINWALFSFFLLAATTSLFFIDVDSYESFTKEDALAENLSFFFYLVAGLIILFATARNTHPQARGVLPVLLGLFFIVVAGEEISWGQRILDFNTPDAMLESNTQGEFNFHNLEVFDKHEGMLNQHTLLNIFVLLNGIIFPLAYYFQRGFQRLVVRFKFPIIPIACMPIFLIAMMFGQSISKQFPHWAHTEVKELFYAFGFLVFAFSFYAGTNLIKEETPRRDMNS